MTSKSTLVFALFLTSTAAVISVHAETYQWKDNSGQTVISDVPPPATAKGQRSIGAVKPFVVSEAVPDKSADAPKAGEPSKNTAEKDFDFKKRQQEAREKADKQAKEQAAEAEKRDNCERARRNLVALESDRAISSYNDKGERQLMDTAQRDQEIERARKVMADTCK